MEEKSIRYRRAGKTSSGIGLQEGLMSILPGMVAREFAAPEAASHNEGLPGGRGCICRNTLPRETALLSG